MAKKQNNDGSFEDETQENVFHTTMGNVKLDPKEYEEARKEVSEEKKDDKSEKKS